MKKGHYTSWATLFKIHCRAYQVIDHIIPAKPTAATPPPTDPAAAATAATAQWSRLDAIILQWIYSTISHDFLHTILQPEATAQEAWENLANIFQDNKNFRALYLEHQFTNLKLDNFTNVSAYCQELKNIVDQLLNVGSPVSEHRLVVQLISGLNSNYDNVAMIIQQSNPLPPFYEARSKLILEENRKAHQSSTALLSTTNTDAKLNPLGSSSVVANTATPPSVNNTTTTDNRSGNTSYHGWSSHGNYRGRGRGRGSRSGTSVGSQQPNNQLSPLGPNILNGHGPCLHVLTQPLPRLDPIHHHNINNPMFSAHDYSKLTRHIQSHPGRRQKHQVV